VLDFLGRGVRALEVLHHLAPQQRKPCGAIYAAVSRKLGVEGLDHHGNSLEYSTPKSSTDRPGSSDRAGPVNGLILAAALDNDVMMPMVRTVDRTADDDGVGVAVTAAVIVECDLAVVAVVETLAVLIDDHGVVVVPVMVPVMGGDDDGFVRGCHRRCRQAKRKRAQDDGFHCKFSDKIGMPLAR
jgi:hypothetical protein